jgi:ATP-dependent Clp protease ATP-binding subunit ClpA
MTASAEKLDPVIGRDDEIDRLVCILCRRTKNCAALVGAAGVGKTAVVEGLARRIAAGTVPDALAGARIVEVDFGAMVAGTVLRGMFEERMKNVIKEAEDANGKIILFIDEMHMMLGAGRGQYANTSTDGANLLKPALARGRIRCVGATTYDEFRTYVEKDAALERRFQKVHIEEPSVEATIRILQGLKTRYQEHHGVEIQEPTLVAAAHLAGRYITDRRFPDKAIDLIDEACATKKLRVIAANAATLQTRSQEEAPKELLLGPDDVAQVINLIVFFLSYLFKRLNCLPLVPIRLLADGAGFLSLSLIKRRRINLYIWQIDCMIE